MDIILYSLFSSTDCLILYSFDNYKERFCLGHLFSLLFFLSFFFFIYKHHNKSFLIHARLVSNTCPIGIKKINKKTKRSREKRIVLSGQVISSNKGLMLKNINLESLCANQFLLATCDYLNPHQLLQHYGFLRISNTSFMPN